MKFDERIGGVDVFNVEMVDFKEFVSIYFIYEMKIFGSFYIWINNYVWSRNN